MATPNDPVSIETIPTEVRALIITKYLKSSIGGTFVYKGKEQKLFPDENTIGLLLANKLFYGEVMEKMMKIQVVVITSAKMLADFTYDTRLDAMSTRNMEIFMSLKLSDAKRIVRLLSTYANIRRLRINVAVKQIKIRELPGYSLVAKEAFEELSKLRGFEKVTARWLYAKGQPRVNVYRMLGDARAQMAIKSLGVFLNDKMTKPKQPDDA